MVKCWYCKKKTVLSFKCTCEHEYCVSCRLPEVHKCDTKIDKTDLIKKLVKIVPNKVTII